MQTVNGYVWLMDEPQMAISLQGILQRGLTSHAEEFWIEFNTIRSQEALAWNGHSRSTASRRPAYPYLRTG